MRLPRPRRDIPRRSPRPVLRFVERGQLLKIANRERQLWELLNLPGLPKRTCNSPFRKDRHASFSISRTGELFNDFATGTGGDAIDFLEQATGLNRAAACRRFIELAGGSPEIPPMLLNVPQRDAPRSLPELPPMATGQPDQFARLAALRQVSVEACMAASDEIGRAHV